MELECVWEYFECHFQGVDLVLSLCTGVREKPTLQEQVGQVKKQHINGDSMNIPCDKCLVVSEMPLKYSKYEGCNQISLNGKDVTVEQIRNMSAEEYRIWRHSVGIYSKKEVVI